MAIPTKEELKAQRELKEYLKTLSKDSEVFTGLAGGFAAVGRGVSTASKIAKTVKNSKQGKDVFNQLASKLKSFQSTAKKGGKKAKSTVKEVVETKPTIPTTIPSTMELAQIPGSSAKTIKEGIKSFTGKTEKFVSKDPRLSSGRLKPFKDNKGLDTPDVLKFKTSGSGPASMEYKAIDPSKALSSKPMKDIVREDMLKALKVSAGIGAAGAGVIMGTDYLRGTFSPELVRKTNLSKTGLVDLKRINKNNLKDSSIPGVKKITAIVNGKEKEFGIVWDNKTKSWDYYRDDKTKKTTETPKPDLKREDVRGGYTPIKDNKGSGTGSGGKTTTGGGTGTTPRSATGQSFDKAFAEARKQAGGAGGIFEWNGKKYGTALRGETVPKDRVEVGKTTAPLMGDEYYKANPDLQTRRQADDDKQLLARAEAQKKEMKEFKPTESLDVLPIPTKPLSSLMFKTSTLNPKTNSRVEPVSYDTIDIVDTKSKKLKKKSYGGNLAMLKYMKQ